MVVCGPIWLLGGLWDVLESEDLYMSRMIVYTYDTARWEIWFRTSSRNGRRSSMAEDSSFVSRERLRRVYLAVLSAVRIL